MYELCSSVNILQYLLKIPIHVILYTYPTFENTNNTPKTTKHFIYSISIVFKNPIICTMCILYMYNCNQIIIKFVLFYKQTRV